jgi:high-affinity nickel-transport protein
VHGLAGTAALTLLILNDVMREGSRALGFAYLFIFGLGSVGGMLLMSALISVPFAYTAARFRRVHTPARVLTGLLSVAFGLYYAWESMGGM